MSSFVTGRRVTRRVVTRRITVERLVLVLVVAMGVAIFLVNLSVTTKHRGNVGNDNRNLDGTPMARQNHKEKQNPVTVVSADETNHGGGIDEHLLKILRHVGIHNTSQLTVAESHRLPTWEHVVEKFGNGGPRILGLETCPTFRSQVAANRRKLGVAGPFNSGTHFLFEILRKNCKTKKRNGKRKNEVLYQVPWGKHQSANFRLLHNTQISHSLQNDNEKDSATGKLEHPELPKDLLEDNKSVLPIVVVRDPYTWWQSMCRNRYAAHWYHVVPDHCPNFVPNNIEREWFHKKKTMVQKHYNRDPWKVDNVMDKANFTLDKNVIPLWVRYHSENRQHASLAHMWTDWYRDYYDGDFPRLLVRLEDLVFHPHETLRKICECANDDDSFSDNPEDSKAHERSFDYVGDANLELVLESAIGGSGMNVDNIHGKDRTDLLDAMVKHAGPDSNEHRLKGMTPADLAFAEAILHESPIWKAMGYQIPPH